MPTVAPLLETPRLRLRPHRAEDWAALIDLWTNPETVRFVGGGAIASPQEIWFRLLRYAGMWPILGYGYWLVEEKATGDLVGDIGFGDFHRDTDPPMLGQPEAGWVLHPKHHGKGYATEATQAMFAWADATGLPSSFCIISPGNKPSLRIAEKLGFTLSGSIRIRTETIHLLRR